VAADLLNIRLMQVLGISLAVMGVISVIIFEFSIKGGVTVSMESGHVKTFKGEEYETVLTIETRGTDWIGSMPTTFKIETGQLMKIEPIAEGRVRLRFLGKYAGRSEGVKVGISLTDPLKLLKRLDQVVYSEFVLDTLPLSLLAPVTPRRLTVSGYGDQPTGYPGPGQELYGLDEYHSSGDTKDIIWKRVAKSPDETLIARVREANVREVVRVGVVQFAERGEDRAAWIDMLCEALGYLGKEVFEMGATVTVHYHSPPGVERRDAASSEEERLLGLTHLRAKDLPELAEVVMSCSVASGSREIETVVSNSDFVITGLKELEDERMAIIISEKPMLLIYEDASPSSTFPDRSVIYSGKENLYPLIRKMLER
jgi:uncharacterized protein (DUF58 family)